MNDKLKTYILNSYTENPKILDLGCGTPWEIFCLFKDFKIQRNKYFTYVGVDKEEEFNIINWPNKGLREKYEIKDIDWVNKIKNSLCEDISEENDFLIDINLFEKYFKFHFNTDLVLYLRSLSSDIKYDFIILSNVLHKLNYSDADFVFNKCLSLIAKKGAIYVSVLGDQYEEKLQEDNLYNYKRYSEMKQKVKVLWKNEDERYNFQLIGKKI